MTIGPAALGIDAAGNIVNAGVNLGNSALPLSTAFGSAAIPSGGIPSGVTTPTGPPMPPPDINKPNEGIMPPVPTGVGNALTWDDFMKAFTSASGVSNLISTGVGLYGADKAADVAKEQNDFLKGVYEREQTNRQPWIDYAANMRDNPNTYYESAPAMGSVEAVLRKLSAGAGNPINNPGALSQAAAYNLGGYNDALTRAAGIAGIGNASAIGGLAGNAANSGLLAGQAQQGIYNVGQSGLASLLDAYRTGP
jgi:hypothetical protein